MGAIRARDLKTLATLGEIQDQEYQDPEFHRLLALRQVRTLFSKNEFFTDDKKCSLAAEKSFLEAEKLCRITNKRLDWYYSQQGRLDPALRTVLSRMEREIASLLGDMETNLPDIRRMVRLTNGATEDRTRKRSHPFMKITGRLRAPRTAIPQLGTYLQEIGVELSSCKFTAVEHNTVVMVPKSWKTHRTIAKEPTHSLPFQLALDSFLKRKLRRWGIDLSSQEKNQELARLGSLDGSLATIDLAMASDTLSFNAVAWMLPTDWFGLFKSFRSSSYRASFGSGSYAKFSSMGNGYTFTLETLIFGAACRAVGSQRYAVYGDDIVIESELVTKLYKLLSFLGFKTNKEKSFVRPDSRFRESCGCDYYRGSLVTPFYLREVPKFSDRPGLCHMMNGLLKETFPGQLWDQFLRWIRDHQIRLVPQNEDTRSGVFISPTMAWRTGRLFVERKPQRWGSANPDYGFAVFQGYSPIQDVRKTHGWRSLLLWHMRAVGEVRALINCPKRFGQLLLALNASVVSDVDQVRITSYVALRSRYVHKTKRFAPVHNRTADYLFLWDEVVGSNLPPRKLR
jgi:hypothetical protein